jgi:hypothetical protein
MTVSKLVQKYHLTFLNLKPSKNELNKNGQGILSFAADNGDSWQLFCF